MTSIQSSFMRINPNMYLQQYMKTRGISDENTAKQELQSMYGEPQQQNSSNSTTELGTDNLDYMSLQGNYNIALQNINYSNNNTSAGEQDNGLAGVSFSDNNQMVGFKRRNEFLQ